MQKNIFKTLIAKLLKIKKKKKAYNFKNRQKINNYIEESINLKIEEKKIQNSSKTKKYSLKKAIKKFIKEKNNFILNLTLDVSNFNSVNFVYKNKPWLNFPSKYEQYSMVDTVTFMLTFENRLLKGKKKKEEKEKKNI